MEFTLFLLSHQRQRSHNFQYFGHHIEIFWKKVCLSLHLVEIETGPDPDRHALDADPFTDRQNDADPIGSGSTTLVMFLKLSMFGAACA
jgi:hypothetical protein